MRLLADHRTWLDFSHLHGHPCQKEDSIYSQNGEDGILRTILEQLQIGSGYFWEIGAADGSENCTRALAEQEGWTGLWVEGNSELAKKAGKIGNPLGVKTLETFVTTDNIKELAKNTTHPSVLVIDIDGNDFWIWRELGKYIEPSVVVIETNNSFGRNSHWVMPYNAHHQWKEDRNHGATLEALSKLGLRLGYTLIANDSSGVNAFFVKSELATRFPQPGNLSAHFAPPLYKLPYGHPWPQSEEINSTPLSHKELTALEISNLELLVIEDLAYVAVLGIIKNPNQRWIPHTGPFPVNIGWNWNDGITSNATRASLPAAIPPGQTMPFVILDRNPPEKIETMFLSIVQEQVGWAFLQQGQSPVSFPVQAKSAGK